MSAIEPKIEGWRTSDALIELVGVAEPRYLRHEYVQALSHEGLMVLVRTLTFAPDRDERDDAMLDGIALELAFRQAPRCRVCECGEPGECDERCDWIAGARL